MLKINIKKRIIRPYNLFILSYFLCFLLWSYPYSSYVFHGFRDRMNLCSFGGLSLLTFIIYLYAFSYIGYNVIGKRNYYVKINKNFRYEYIYFFCLSLLGIVVVLYKLISIGGLDIYKYVFIGRANDLKKILYSDYSFGIISLRYNVIILSSIVIYRLIGLKKFIWIDLVSLCLMLVVTLISSRLTLVASLVGAGYLIVFLKEGIKISLLKTLLLIIFLFLLLCGLNWTRNYGFYNNADLGFFMGGVSEIVRYVGTPFQGAITIFNNIGSIHSTSRFYQLSSIDPSLTTNSAFADISLSYGIWAIFFVGFIFLVVSFLIRFFECYSNGRYCYVNIPLIYSFCEFWRIFLFDKGIILATLICSVFIAGVVSFLLYLTKVKNG